MVPSHFSDMSDVKVFASIANNFAKDYQMNQTNVFTAKFLSLTKCVQNFVEHLQQKYNKNVNFPLLSYLSKKLCLPHNSYCFGDAPVHHLELSTEFISHRWRQLTASL